MSNPIRCYSTNSSIGEYYTVFMALRDHLNRNPPAEGEKQLIDYLKEFGIVLYPQIMRTITNARFIDAGNIHIEPYKKQ